MTRVEKLQEALQTIQEALRYYGHWKDSMVPRLSQICDEALAFEEADRPTFHVYDAESDGVKIVHVETAGVPADANGPRIRIYLNDEIIFENPALPEATD